VFQRSREWLRRRIVRAEQHMPLRIANLVEEVLFVLFGREGISQLSLSLLLLLFIIVFILRTIKVVQHQRQEALCRFLQRAVEYLIDLMTDRNCCDADADEPDAPDKDDESADQAAAHAPRVHDLPLQSIANAAHCAYGLGAELLAQPANEYFDHITLDLGAKRIKRFFELRLGEGCAWTLREAFE
jgi:hypothetical protein